MKKITKLFCAAAMIVAGESASAQSLFKDLIPGGHPNSSNIEKFTNVGSTMFFVTRVPSGSNGIYQLWKSDGTPANTLKVKDSLYVTNSSGLIHLVGDVGGELFFFKTHPASSSAGPELWKSDGTTAGTVIVKTFPVATSAEGDKPKNYAIDGNRFFFTIGQANGREVWVSDGTAAGTVEVIDLWPGNIMGYPYGGAADQQMVAYNGKVYFAGTTTGDYELYSSDGTAAGTVMYDLYPGGSASNPGSWTIHNGELYFTAHNGVSPILWKTDGTTMTQLSSGGNASATIEWQNMVYFQQGFDLWKTDGTVGGATLVATNVSNTAFQGANDDYLFTTKDGIYYRTDGTTAGTVTVTADVGTSASFSVIDNIMYKSRLDVGSWTVVGLWKSDGTETGTSKIHFGTATGFAHVFGDKLFFSEYDAANGSELWWLNTALSTEIADVSTANAFSTYPNPTSGILNIITEAQTFTAEIFDIRGQLISTKQNTLQLDVTGIAPGTYLLKLTPEGGAPSVSRFIKQ
jgi:ELWxxDGT repeat protein